MLIPVRVLIEKSDVSGTGTQATLQEYSRSDVFGEPFPNEDGEEDEPEELDTLLLSEDALATVESVEELDGREQVGEDDVGGVYEESTHDTTETVTDELRADKGEDTNADVGVDVVVQVVSGENADGESRVGGGGGEDRDGDMLLEV